MSTYMEIEAKRVSENPRYVIYEYYKLDERCTDEYSTEFVWSKYFVNTANSSREKIYNEALIRHDYFSDRMQNYLNIERLLILKGCDDGTIDEFKRLLTINRNDDITCELMITAGATVNFNAIYNDLNKCRNYDTKAILKILNNIAEQVNCAAINGVFTKMFKNAYRLSGSQKPIQEYEDRIENLYNALLFGSNKTNPIYIPVAYQKFEIIKTLNSIALQYERLDTADVPSMIKAYYNASLKTLKEYAI